jgi:hypothetical protein
MTFMKALGWGVAAALVATAGVLLVGFLGGVTIDLPGVVELTSSSEGAPQAELRFNPLAPLLLAIVLAAIIWLVGRLTGKRRA